MDKVYRIKFYFRIFWLLLPIYYSHKMSVLGLAFYLTDFYEAEIDPSFARKFVTSEVEPKTFIVSGNRSIGKRMIIVELK